MTGTGPKTAAPWNWSTDQCAPRERAAYWREAVCREFVLLETELREPARFFGHIRSRALGPLLLADIHSAPQRVWRTPSHLGRASGEFYFLILQQQGAGRVLQQGREACLLPGDAAIVDTRRPYTLAFDRPFEQVNVSIPVQCLEGESRDLLPTGVRLRNVGRLLDLYLEMLAQYDAHSDAARALVNNIVDMLEVVARHQDDGAAVHPDARFAAAIEYMARRFRDPGLSAAAVAAASHVSVRLLHKLFAARGTTFGTELRNMRLEYARRRMAAEAGREATILDIALEAGYGNVSGFSRAFRQRYGLSPSEYRREAAGS